MKRADSEIAIREGTLGERDELRRPLLYKIHDVFAAKLAKGASPTGTVQQLESLWRFIGWVDSTDFQLSEETAATAFSGWTEALIHRYRVAKNLTHLSAYSEGARIADVIARASGLLHKNPGAALLRQTRLRVPNLKKRVLGTQADKQNLSDTFTFGHVLADICMGLTLEVVRGPLPVRLPIAAGANTLIIAGGVRDVDLNPEEITDLVARNRAIRVRAALLDGQSVVDQLNRTKLLNVRIEAELLIFIAQTSINLSQAKDIRRETYRWQTDGDDFLAFRVYKSRRQGEAVFRCFKAYRSHLERYLKWLDAVGLSASDDRLFPFIYLNKVPAAHAAPECSTTRAYCKELGIPFFGPQALRKTRVNWLLRRSRDPDLTADQSGNTKETLLRVYEQPHHQVAATEIRRFHTETDPSSAAPGPGPCASAGKKPTPLDAISIYAPEPDCISPDGCLFCTYHRDVMSEDYCWKLASHSKLKVIELTLYKPPKDAPSEHPAALVIQRLRDKLAAIADGSEIRRRWVRDADERVRAGRYHPYWDGHIALLELFA